MKKDIDSINFFNEEIKKNSEIKNDSNNKENLINISYNIDFFKSNS